MDQGRVKGCVPIGGGGGGVVGEGGWKARSPVPLWITMAHDIGSNAQNRFTISSLTQTTTNTKSRGFSYVQQSLCSNSLIL